MTDSTAELLQGAAAAFPCATAQAPSCAAAGNAASTCMPETQLRSCFSSVGACLTISCAAAVQAFRVFGLPEPIAVPSQADPNPEFPTVEFPNPEEGKGVWSAAYQHAEATGASLVLATDPDADRFSASEWDAQAGERFTKQTSFLCLPQQLGTAGLPQCACSIPPSHFSSSWSQCSGQQLSTPSSVWDAN